MENTYFNYYYNIKPILHKENKKLSSGRDFEGNCYSYVITHKSQNYYDITLDLFRYKGKNFITLYKNKLSKEDLEPCEPDHMHNIMKKLIPVKKFIMSLYSSLLIKEEDKNDLNECLTLLDTEVKETDDTVIYPFTINSQLHYQLKTLLEFYFTSVKTDYEIGSGEIILNNKLFKHFNVFSLNVRLMERQNGKEYFNFYLVLNSGHFFYKLKRDTREQTWILDEIETITSDEVCFLEYYRVLKQDLEKFITGYNYCVEISDFLKERYGELLESTFNLHMRSLDFIRGYGKDSSILHDRFLNEKTEFNFLLNSTVRHYLKQLPTWEKIKHVKF